MSAKHFAPSRADDEAFRQSWGRFERFAVSPAGIKALLEMLRDTDARHVLPAITAPTLVVHRQGDRIAPVQGARFIAERIAGAKYVELPGIDHLAWVGNCDEVPDEVEEFLTGVRPRHEFDRVLATVLFTDIVGATDKAAQLGDRDWTDLLERHHTVIREHLKRFRGQEIDTAGDGFLASFDGPARGVQCACSIVQEVRRLGLQIRAGLHTGECEVMNDKLTGIAVHTGARVAAFASEGEVLVSSTVKDLMAGSKIGFRERGEHVLKGVPGRWRLFAVDFV